MGGILALALISTALLQLVCALIALAIVWMILNPTENPFTAKWLSLIPPAVVGGLVGITLAWKNWRAFRADTLNGVEVTSRALVGGAAAAMETHVGFITVVGQHDQFMGIIYQASQAA